MRKVNTVTNTANKNGEFTDGNAAAGIKPTELLAGWFNTVQRELVAVVEDAGEYLDPDDDEQISKIIRGMRNYINHYRNYGYPEWESGISYYEGAVVYYHGDLYLSLSDSNSANIPGTNDSIWQRYIQREATKEEAIAGDGSVQAITPRRLHDGASYLDEQLKTTLTPYLLPVGAIIMWPSATPPDGWLELNGQAFDKAENPKLTALFPGGVIPDYRGRFVRGWANGATVDPDAGRAVNSLQGDELRAHFHFSQWLGFDNSNNRNGSGGGPGGFRYAGGDDRNWAGVANRDLMVGGSETRPVNIAAMYIIKTDRAEADNSESTTPSSLVITPASVTISAGSTRKFTGTLLPAELAVGYPVSWIVSDPALGSIDSNGLYTATAGQSGTQSIIASISTGLTSTAVVTQHVYLTSIEIGAIPAKLLVGNTYSIPVLYSPTHYTEEINPASSDTAVAILASDGTLTVSGAGTATLSLTGANSGVTASITITATEEEVPEVYLAIDNNLSEIAGKGAEAQAKTRKNIGMGELATKDTLTAGEVGAVPQDTASLGSTDLNTVVLPGRKFQSLTSNATTARHYPVTLAGMLDVIKTAQTGIRQIYYPYNTTDVYHRYCEDVTADASVWSDWGTASGGDYLDAANNLSDVKNAATARQNIGVSYTISTDVAPADASSYAAGHVWYQVEES
ncbi:tail fiber protein [Vagococcus sp. WN89Y]|uniref:tail fiber protein n=1 Tax=Vagococcus sp. WN89Y TaxID=3457258 RepID=UPI003FCEA210